MSGLPIFLLGMFALVVLGAHMLLRPQVYLDRGTAPIRIPGAARFFGMGFVGIAVVALCFIILKFVTE